MAKNKKPQKTQSRNKTLWIVGVGLGIILCLLGIWSLTRNTTLHVADKEQVRREVQAVLDDISFQPSSVYGKVEDIGCDSRSSVGVASYVHCDFLAQKYFKATGELSASLRDADKKLRESGWVRASGEDLYEEVFEGPRSVQLQYKKNGKSLSLVFYKNAELNSTYDIRELVEKGEISALSDNEFVYGVRVARNYWSCRADSIFKQPCPSPPSKSTY